MNTYSTPWTVPVTSVTYQDDFPPLGTTSTTQQPKSSKHSVAPTFIPSNSTRVIQPSRSVQLPKGVCLKITHLRPRYNHLKHWYETPGNVIATRAGRINYVDETGVSKAFVYDASPWANPFKLSEYSLEECLSRFQSHLHRKLQDPDTLNEFLELANAKEIGCFCLPENGCHRNVILKTLKEKLEERTAYN
ncbi:hypothetical protein BCR33DRAFT_766630 [Rhizoclosmatium globosum]|uniref:DUF4326 domain-containing protein n=1 Tax=Rhizoclosmatium globosum TaxID=329046 RepID=A0A1Y2C8T1_9FUNG|nr:hypothetical protein BCR33DRAFT_766630 [Rhizoclosmatium globosum]|eukprot:ORY43441.1 hypothetical protein BCR33DRAFT_766630 [Rhizoclosmatium globosum]